ncbi:hypothetical protein SK128_025861, partial [Halocaridina rubra]
FSWIPNLVHDSIILFIRSRSHLPLSSTDKTREIFIEYRRQQTVFHTGYTAYIHANGTTA